MSPTSCLTLSWYDLLLVLFALVSLPKFFRRRGKDQPTLKDRFGYAPPEGSRTVRIWIHAVSLGEVKAALPLIRLLPKEAEILLTTSTATGFQEALRHKLRVRFFPLDFSWIMRRWLRSFRPTLLLFIEGDLWPNLLREARLYKVKTALVSGKVSEKSAKRFRFFSRIANALFGKLDLLAVQNEEYRERFASFVERPIEVSGNLKLDFSPQPTDPEATRRRFSLAPDQLVITLASTHAPEEKELLEELQGLWQEWPNLVLFLAPRHPERIEEVAALLRARERRFCRWSEGKSAPIVLVDRMGELAHLYAISALSIVAGSFSSRIGGHNVLEPCLYGCPVLFGPHMEAQKEFAKRVLEGEAGAQVTVRELESKVREFLTSPHLSKQAYQVAEEGKGAAVRAMQLFKESGF
jgi:3-deoxy-D-manno-octulosonic-acid transferase